MSAPTIRDETFDTGCRACPRLADYLAQARARFPDYHALPVPSFGDPKARLLVVGLAPGMHGANRSGRPFTGDFAGRLLYQTLHRHGFASAPQSVSRDDGLVLPDCRITNAVRCVPPQNKPETAEVRRCNRYLAAELALVPEGGAVLALGAVAHRAVVLALGLRPGLVPFSHGASHALAGDVVLFDSYHCSRYNTQTRRLTEPMFEAVFAGVARHLAKTPRARSAARPCSGRTAPAGQGPGRPAGR